MSIAYDDALFRAQFPEFGDTTKYPPALLSMYWGMASNFIDAGASPCAILSGSALPYALNCMTAQLLVLAAQQAAAIAAGQATSGGIEVSATVDKVSVDMMAPPVADMWEYWLALTPYGQQLLALLKTLAVGGISIGGMNESGSFRRSNGMFL
jgi:hypothetical protein